MKIVLNDTTELELMDGSSLDVLFFTVPFEEVGGIREKLTPSNLENFTLFYESFTGVDSEGKAIYTTKAEFGANRTVSQFGYDEANGVASFVLAKDKDAFEERIKALEDTIDVLMEGMLEGEAE